MRIFIGNLPFSVTEEDVRELFTAHGTVLDCVLPMDRESGRPRGFGFVDMSDEEAARAISALDGHEFGERQLTVNEARPRAEGRGERP